MKIDNKLITDAVEKGFGNLVKKETGCNVDIHVNAINMGMKHIHLNVDLAIDNKEIPKILEKLVKK